MIIELSPELKMKFLNEKELNIEAHQKFQDIKTFNGIQRIPTISWTEIQLDLINEPELYEECKEWLRIQLTYYQTSCGATKVNIGPFDGIYISECNDILMLVRFLVDTHYPGRKDWKDWFVQGEKHASF